MALLRRYAASYGSHKGPEAAVEALGFEGRCDSFQTTAARRPEPGLQEWYAGRRAGNGSVAQRFVEQIEE